MARPQERTHLHTQNHRSYVAVTQKNNILKSGSSAACTMDATTSKAVLIAHSADSSVLPAQAHSSRSKWHDGINKLAEIAPDLLVSSAVGYAHTHAHARSHTRSSTIRGCNKGKE